MKDRFFNLILACCLFSLTVYAGEARYIFYFIGDGMGPNQVLSTEMYLAELEGRISRRQLAMTQFPYSGQAATFSSSNGITDSSAAGTALSSGKKTTNGTLGLDDEGKPVHTIAEILKERGWAVGITTSVSIDHATPGAFYAHVKKRNEYYMIGRQLAESNFDFFGGATFYQPYDPNADKSECLYDLAEQNRYTIARGYSDYNDKKYDAEKMILIQSFEGLEKDYKGGGMIPYAIDKQPDDLTLPQITTAAIDFLQRNDRFFLMVEGGAIDWACHSNDAATVIKEVIEFDDAIKVALDFYYAHPDETLIVITADHETGGMALGNSDYTLNLQLLQNQHLSVDQLSDKLKKLYVDNGASLKWDAVKQVLQADLGFYNTVEISADDEKMLKNAFKKLKKNKQNVKTLYKNLNKLADTAVRLIDKKAKVGWTTGSHSAAAVPVFAIGAGAEQFTGWQDNTQIMPKMLKSAKE
ncbi:MAG: alkaline phosphatase [Paludibacteraceae bacterium]|nr:alkaline phosphatase [Paludibacteraceae bacterium]